MLDSLPVSEQYEAAQNSKEYQNVLKTIGLDGLIWEGCVDLSSVVKVCAKVTLRNACVSIKLVKTKVAEACADWNVNNSKLSIGLDFPTVNVGIYKLETNEFEVEHDISSGDGGIFYTGKLYKYQCSREGCKFEVKKEWPRHKVVEW